MGLANLTVDKIRRVCTAQSYERGAGYYNSGRITSVRLAGSTVKATVEGSDDYNVELAWNGDDGKYYCDCPYSYEGECKHVVSVLLHVKDHSAEMIVAANRASSEAKKLLDGAGEGYLREFLAAEMAGDPGLAERFARGAAAPQLPASPADPSGDEGDAEGDEEGTRGGEEPAGGAAAAPPPRRPAGVDYYDRLASMYRAEAAAWQRGGGTGKDDYGHVDLKGAMGDAAAAARSGSMAEASGIYRQIASAVSDHLDYVLKDGPHRRVARTAIARWATCMDKSGPAVDERRECISDAFSGYRRGDDFSTAYESALWSLCRSDGDLVYLLDLIAPHMPDPLPADGSEGAGSRRVKRIEKPLRRRRRDFIEQESGERIRMLRIQIKALEMLGRERDIDLLLEEHGRADPAACAMRVRRMAESGAKARAARAAAEGLDLFGNDEPIVAAAEAVFGKGEAGRVRVLSGLFMRTLKWSYYDQLRRLPGWPRERAAVLKWLAGDKRRHDMLVEMLVSEGMLGRALREIAKRNDAALFEEYARPVAGSNPGAYLAAYGRCVAGLADRAREKFDRSRVVGHLRIMAGIAGGKEAAAALAADISARNPSKRALLEMLAPYAKRSRARAGAAKAARPSGGRAGAGGPRAARGRARRTTRPPRSRRGQPD